MQSSSKENSDLDMPRAFCDMGEYKLWYLVWDVIMSLGNVNCRMCQTETQKTIKHCTRKFGFIERENLMLLEGKRNIFIRKAQTSMVSTGVVKIKISLILAMVRLCLFISLQKLMLNTL